MKSLVCSACLFHLIVLPAIGQPLPGLGQRNHDITIDDYFTQADLFSCQISPDGRNTAYIQGSWQKSTNDRKTDLWIVSTENKQTTKLTFDRANDRSPQWSSNSRHIYFLGNRKRAGEKRPPFDGSTQIWKIPVIGGTPTAVTRVPAGIEQFRFSPDGESIYYLRGNEEIHGDWKNLRSQFKDIQYGHGKTRFSQLWKLDLKTWRAKKVLDKNIVIREFAISPNGRTIAMITTPDRTVVSYEGKSRVVFFDLRAESIVQLPDKVFRKDAPSPYGWLESLAWSSKGNWLAFNVVFDAYPSEVVVAKMDQQPPHVFLLPRMKGVSLRGYGSPLAWHPTKEEICFLGDQKGRTRVYGVSNFSGKKKPEFHCYTAGDFVASDFNFSQDGRLGIIMNNTNHLPDIYLGGKKKIAGTPGTWRRKPERLTSVNPQARTWKLPQISVVSWKGAKGDRVEGILELPPGYQPGKKLPLVVQIHGGPTTCTPYCLRFWIYGRTLLAAKGYAVLCPNYRGSTGYGDEFLTDLVGKENNIEVEDLLKGVDAMIDRGIADPERLAVMGWSNGGYLTNCLISRTTRFKAAISGASIVDAVMEFGANDEPAYAIVFKKGFPWNSAKFYHKASPTYDLNKIKTPTLIHVGAKDERCPPGHSRLLYRALKQYLKVPTELLVYPGEGHGLTKYNHRRAKLEWDLAWLDRYVLGKKGK